MARVRCRACGGRYQETLEDGTEYYHACPPVVHVHVRRSGLESDVPLDRVRPFDEVQVRRSGAIVWTLVNAMLLIDERLGDTSVPRVPRRNEHVDRAKLRNPLAPHRREDVLIDPGAGVEPAP